MINLNFCVAYELILATSIVIPHRELKWFGWAFELVLQYSLEVGVQIVIDSLCLRHGFPYSVYLVFKQTNRVTFAEKVQVCEFTPLYLEVQCCAFHSFNHLIILIIITS